MRLTFNLEMTDGTSQKVQTAYADIMALEERFDMDASDLATRQKAVWLAYLCWHSMKRRGLTEKPFDEWKSEVEVLEPSDDEAQGKA